MSNTPKKSGIMGKLLLGVVIGSAVAAVANPKSRKFLKEKGEEALDAGKQFLEEQQKEKDSLWHRMKAAAAHQQEEQQEEKTSLWHRLHQLVHGKKR